ncbi:mitochondrial carrier protein MTM1-like [Zingiber officinale]|uniref:mitochondrial carrier protein MTM1-like n=1 Tax=Zingiber officinale TaxID=94328 RepID=UPI001C4AC3BA|nr:mitochondrial carrier protein MTM1-like [Zingiber officinale]
MAEPSSSTSPFRRLSSSDADMSFAERAFSAAGAAVVSAIIVNPLDVAKTRLQAQAGGVPYHQVCTDICCYPSYIYGGRYGSGCSPDCSRYRGTFDVFYKVIKQEGYARLWRGTNASLVLAVPTVGIYLPCYDIFRNWMENITSLHKPELTPYVPLLAGSAARTLACLACSPIELARTRMQAFKSSQTGSKLPGMWTTLLGVLSPGRSNTYLEKMQGYRVLWMGAGAQLARDVPFSAICWSTLEPTRRRLLGMVEDGNAFHVLGANFLAGYVAGSLAAAATCPLDVAKTRRQIENDPEKMLMTTTRNTLLQVWRNEGAKGLFTGVGPRVARAGPSVGIVISFYEVVKYLLHRGHADS